MATTPAAVVATISRVDQVGLRTGHRGAGSVLRRAPGVGLIQDLGATTIDGDTVGLLYDGLLVPWQPGAEQQALTRSPCRGRSGRPGDGDVLFVRRHHGLGMGHHLGPTRHGVAGRARRRAGDGDLARGTVGRLDGGAGPARYGTTVAPELADAFVLDRDVDSDERDVLGPVPGQALGFVGDELVADGLRFTLPELEASGERPWTSPWMWCRWPPMRLSRSCATRRSAGSRWSTWRPVAFPIILSESFITRRGGQPGRSAATVFGWRRGTQRPAPSESWIRRVLSRSANRCPWTWRTRSSASTPSASDSPWSGPTAGSMGSTWRRASRCGHRSTPVVLACGSWCGATVVRCCSPSMSTEASGCTTPGRGGAGPAAARRGPDRSVHPRRSCRPTGPVLGGRRGRSRPGVLAEAACAATERSLTEEEWARFLPGRRFDPTC